MGHKILFDIKAQIKRTTENGPNITIYRLHVTNRFEKNHMKHKTIKLMTYNVGGGRKNLGSRFDSILNIIKQETPDILAVQESAMWTTLDGMSVNQTKLIADVGRLKYSYFGPTLSMRENFHVLKELFVYGIFNDWKNWHQGNALFSQWPFVSFYNDNPLGKPENIPIYQPTYEGSRDTDPRFVILAKLDLDFTKAFAMTTHLTTLYGERGAKEIPNKNEEAQIMRWKQCERIIDLIREFVLEKNELVFFLGDFNAVSSELGIQNSLEKKGGFVRLIPKNSIGSHMKLDNPVDHIFIFPGKYHIKYSCKIIDTEFKASDHNPVVANIDLFDENSKPFKDLGPGVFQEAML